MNISFESLHGFVYAGGDFHSVDSGLHGFPPWDEFNYLDSGGGGCDTGFVTGTKGKRVYFARDFCDASQSSASEAARKTRIALKYGPATTENIRSMPKSASRVATTAQILNRTFFLIRLISTATAEIWPVKGKEVISLKSRNTSKLSGQAGSCSKVRKWAITSSSVTFPTHLV